MSAALTLPYVWAATCSEPEQREYGHVGEGIQFYRRRTEKILSRYLMASIAVGRVASVMEDVTLRGRASNYHAKNFEDAVIFAIDVENCLRVLDAFALKLVVKIALQDYMISDVAEQLRLSPRTVGRNYGRALDCLSREFLEKGLLVEGN